MIFFLSGLSLDPLILIAYDLSASKWTTFLQFQVFRARVDMSEHTFQFVLLVGRVVDDRSHTYSNSVGSSTYIQWERTSSFGFGRMTIEVFSTKKMQCML